MWIETSTPLTIRRRSGDVRLLPGQPVDFPEAEALKLLAKAQGKVREATGSFDHIEDIEERKTTRALTPGDRVTWQGADRPHRTGVVEFLHTDTDGTVWAFCACPDGRWAAVNTKYLTPIEGEGS